MQLVKEFLRVVLQLPLSALIIAEAFYLVSLPTLTCPSKIESEIAARVRFQVHRSGQIIPQMNIS